MFDLQVDGDAAVLHLSGEVDLQSTSELKAEISKLSGLTRLEIRASDVSYIDSSGVAILLLARKLCGERNIMLTIPVVSQALFRVLEIARLDSLLPIGDVQQNKADDTVDPGLAALDALATGQAGEAAADEGFVWPEDDAAPAPFQQGASAENLEFDSDHPDSGHPDNDQLDNDQPDNDQPDNDQPDNDQLDYDNPDNARLDADIVPGRFG